MRIDLDIPPGIISDDTSFASAPRWRDGSNVRFRLGRPQIIGGWELLVSTALTGVCRNIFPWTDNSSIINIGFGTHSALQVWQGGALYTITPTLALPAITLPSAAPIATSNGTPTIVVTWNGHPLIVGDSVVISGASSVATVTINGTWTLTAVTTNTFTFTAGSNASSTTTGGGSAVVVTPQRAFSAGSIDGTGGAGYGTGAYSTGTYSSPSTADYFPRTWSMAAWGANLMACARNGPIFGWTNATGTPAAPIANSPPQVTAMLVAPQQRQLFAFGCNQESSGVFNALCIRHSSVGTNTDWTTSLTSTAREYILAGGGRIVSARMIGNNIAVWTDIGLHLGTYVGSITQPWRFDRIGDRCGLIGPNAVIVVGQTAYWLGPDLQFNAYSLGGAVSGVECPIREDLVNYLAASQADKITASSISEFSEIRFDYPDSRDGYENSRYLSLCIGGGDIGAWHKGIMARTAMVDAAPTVSPIGVTYDGAIYWHERGHSADGSAMASFIESSDQYFSEDFTALVRGCWPDIQGQVGAVSLTLTVRYKPQSDEVVYGPYAMAASEDRLDFRAKGRLFKVKFSANSGPSYWRLGKPIFDVVQAGLR